MRRLAIAALALVAMSVALWIAVRSEGAQPSRAVSRPPAEAPTVVAAPPPAPLPPSAAHADGDPALATLRESGPASEPWDGAATAVFDAIGRRAKTASHAGCFVAGCGATFTFASTADYDRARSETERSADYRAWTGGKRWSVAASAGEVTVAVLLYRPD